MSGAHTLAAEYEYILVQPDNTMPLYKKTGRWWVKNKRHGDVLGLIVWHGPWRQYTFRPSGPAIYSAGCLRDVADFIEKAMAEWRSGRSGS